MPLKFGKVQMADLGLLQFFAVYSTNFIFHVSCSNLLCMLLLTSSRTISILAEKIPNWLFHCNFLNFTSIILPCDNFKSFLYMYVYLDKIYYACYELRMLHNSNGLTLQKQKLSSVIHFFVVIDI